MFRRKDMKAARLAGFFQKFGKLVEQARILFFEGFPNATFEVVIQNFRPNTAQGTGYGGNQAQNLDTIAIGFDHFLQGLRLPFDAAQAGNELFLHFVGAAMAVSGGRRRFHSSEDRGIPYAKNRQRFLSFNAG